ncbi:MAG TPA: hypothetical protein VF791_10905 [Pyrinomonadaceae bacterium]
MSADEKKWIEELVDKLTSAANQGDKREGDNKEFLLHLYDQLWENMRAKENRLWSFLSLYGAAVGLVFAGGQASGLAGAELFALIIVMGLTTWAILIMLNANYWIRRNLLMVGGIEDKYPGIKKGIYPRGFPEAKKGSFDALYRGSILVLSLILLLFFARAIWTYRNPTSFDTFHIFLSVILLYLLLISFALYCLKQHEDYIALHHSTKRKQLLRAEKFTHSNWRDTLQDELGDRKKLSVRPYLLLLLLCVMGLFDFVLRRNGYTWPFILWCIIPQILLIPIFVWQWHKYRSPYNVDAALAPLQNATKAGLLVQVRQEWDSIKANSGKRADLKPKFDELAGKVDAQMGLLEAPLGELKTLLRSLIELDDASIAEGLNKMVADLNKIESPTENTDNEVWATKVDNVVDSSLEAKWYPPENVKILIGILLLSVVNPIYFFYVTKPKLREDFTSGAKTVSSTDLNRQIEKVQQDLKKIENSFQEMQSVETQRELIEQRLIPFQQRLNNLESLQQEMLKPPPSPTLRSTP